MKQSHLFFLNPILLLTTSSLIFSMHSPIQPILQNPLYNNLAQNLAQSYVIAHKDHPHFKDNLEQKADWLRQKLYTYKNKNLTLHVIKNGQTYKVKGLNPLPNFQNYLAKITATAKKDKNPSLYNLFNSYLNNLNSVWQMSLFIRLKCYYGDYNATLENLGLSRISEHIFKNTLMIWGLLNDIHTIYDIEALHFTECCINYLKEDITSNSDVL